MKKNVPKFQIGSRVKINDNHSPEFNGRKGIVKGIKYLSNWGNIYTVEILTGNEDKKEIFKVIQGFGKSIAYTSCVYIQIPDFHESKLRGATLDKNKAELIVQRVAKKMNIEYIGVFMIMQDYQEFKYNICHGNMRMTVGFVTIFDSQESLFISLPNIALVEKSK